jgi:hypothetical protein
MVLFFLVCGFVFLWLLARESIFRLGYFSGFFLFVFIVPTIMFYCTFRRFVLLSFIFFWEQIDSYFIFNLVLRLSTRAGSGWDLFVVLHFTVFSSSFGWYFICLQLFRVLMFIFFVWKYFWVVGLFYVCMVFCPFG